MKSKNTIPKAVHQVISLGANALAGAEKEDALIQPVINTAAKLAADLYDLAGNPATPLARGKQAQYAAQIAAVAVAHAAGRTAVDAGRKFCQFAVDVLKRVLGAKWNSQWNAAGFIAPTLEVPRDPRATLISLRAYYTEHPEHEVALLNLTSAAAQAHLDSVQQTTLAISRARALRVSAKKARDAALAQLRKRLSGLRSELDQLLSKTDGRWYDFGFHRPSDGRKPAPVKSVSLAPVGPAVVLVSWPDSPRAESYRVSWKPIDSSGPATDAGLFANTQATLIGLPVATRIAVGVTARNSSGETAPVEAVIIVPPAEERPRI